MSCKSELSSLRSESEQDKILIDNLTYKLASHKRHSTETVEMQDEESFLLESKKQIAPHVSRKVQELTGHTIDASLSSKAKKCIVALVSSYEKIEKDLQEKKAKYDVIRMITDDMKNDEKHMNYINKVGTVELPKKKVC